MRLKVRRNKKVKPVNRGGRPKGSKNKATVEANKFLRERREKILRKTYAEAMNGNTVLLKFMAEKVAPYSIESFMRVRLPKLNNSEDAKRFAKQVLKKVSKGEYSLESGEKFAGLIERFMGIFSYEDFEKRVSELEKRLNRRH